MNQNQGPRKKSVQAFFATTKGKWVIISLFVFLSIVLVLSLLLIFLPSPQTPHITDSDQEQKDTIPMKPVVSGDEMRGVYIASVHNINFPSRPGLSEAELKRELDEIVSLSAEIGFDTIYFQVRPTADALYCSDVFPSSRFLVSQEGDALSFDVLQYLIEQAAQCQIKVVAWVNPYRITNSSASSQEEALASLSELNPAKIHPEWTVFYQGKLYFDPALPQVRELILKGIEELCCYDIEGILYDDYFYPYPSGNVPFDDESSYQQYGNQMNRSDFRRHNINLLVENTYRRIKAINPDMTFGVSPSGIWQNASSDPRGSQTLGLEAYSAVYADALTWIEGGYIDYISPQIYWERGHQAADFSTLTRWWSAQVDGTDVKLYISHASYKVSDFPLGAEEIVAQIRYARAFMGSCGNIQYGFADIKSNTSGIKDALTSLYQEPFWEENTNYEIEGVSFSRVYNSMRTTANAQFISCASDPNYPVYLENTKVGRTKSGFFSYCMPLQTGNNTLSFIQNNKSYALSIKRISQENTAVPFEISSITPSQNGVIVLSGFKLDVTAEAPSGSRVTVTLHGETFPLRAVPNATSDSQTSLYCASITVPDFPGNGEEIAIGALIFTCERQGVTAVKNGPEVSVLPRDKILVATVNRDNVPLKKTPYSSFYEDPTPSSVGMQDRIIGCQDGYYRLRFGAFIAMSDVTVSEGNDFSSSLVSIYSEADEINSSLYITSNGKPPINVTIVEDTVSVIFYSSYSSCYGEIALSETDHLFESCRVHSNAAKNTVTINLILHSKQNFYGFDIEYDPNGIRVAFRQPQSLNDGALPLTGKTVVIDAGHGGNDFGALGFIRGYDEKELNLKIALALEQILREKGATVILSRSVDETVSLTDRMQLLHSCQPDFSISIHHNSVHESSDANQSGGTLGLYWASSGLSLAERVTSAVSDSIGTMEVGVRSQELALCRNHRFPQALIEVSFICNPSEYHFAITERYSDHVATGIWQGIEDWYRQQMDYCNF